MGKIRDSWHIRILRHIVKREERRKWVEERKFSISVFLYAPLLAAWLHWGAGWRWEAILMLMGGFYIAKKDVIDPLIEMNINEWARPARQPRSIVYPRLWRFKFEWSKKFLEGLLAKRGLAFKFDAAGKEATRFDRDFLAELRLEEYANRLRIHRWLLPPNGTAVHPRYDWYDIPDYWSILHWNTTLSKSLMLWSYEFTRPYAERHDAARLSLVPCFDEKTKQASPRLVLWLEQQMRHPGGHMETVAAEGDEILFDIPLDPDRLADYRADPEWERQGDLQGDLLSLAERKVAAWRCSSETDERINWRWYLELKTLD